MHATAIACANVALIKYWGKRDVGLNLPATGSISLTLAGLETRTSVVFDADLAADELWLNGTLEKGTTARVARILDLVRAAAGLGACARVESENNFPTGAGLASSASGFAALALAASRAAGLALDSAALSTLARRGSGSAARSLAGGFVELHVGTRTDGADCVAEQILPSDAWPLAVVVCVTSSAAKSVGSTAGMESTRATSPYWQGWLASAEQDLGAMRRAVLARDLQLVGELAEHSCLKMHALALSTDPALVYWRPATLAVMHEVYALRRRGVAAYFTIDAGPQVKVLCLPESRDAVAKALVAVPGVERIIHSRPGGAARCIDVTAAVVHP